MIPKGRVIILTNGVYDSFGVESVIVALQDFDMRQVIVDYRDEHVGQNGRIVRGGMSFVEYINGKGFTEYCDTTEINIGQYGEFDPDYCDC